MQSGDSVGVRIFELLKTHRITQKELAKAVGMTEATISRYIKGNRTPNGRNIVKIASALDTTTDYLLYGLLKKEDSYISYYQVKNAIKQHAKTWSAKQKTDLVIALFE